ncbi:MAG: hypothetical protein ACRCWB_11695 [Enterovibrio sp.]
MDYKYTFTESVNPLLMYAINESRGNLASALKCINRNQKDITLPKIDRQNLNNAEKLIQLLIDHGYNKLS